MKPLFDNNPYLSIADAQKVGATGFMAPEELSVTKDTRGRSVRGYKNAVLAYQDMVTAAMKEGVDIHSIGSYRPYQEQIDLRIKKPKQASFPGTSFHGSGLAYDISTEEGLASQYDSNTYRWLAINAGEYGFVNPEWAIKGGRKEEPWHWEYMGRTEEGKKKVAEMIKIAGINKKKLYKMLKARELAQRPKLYIAQRPKLPILPRPMTFPISIQDSNIPEYRPGLINAIMR